MKGLPSIERLIEVFQRALEAQGSVTVKIVPTKSEVKEHEQTK